MAGNDVCNRKHVKGGCIEVQVPSTPCASAGCSAHRCIMRIFSPRSNPFGQSYHHNLISD